MFGFKKKSEDEILSAALLKGITEAKAEQAQKKGRLQKAYNKASGLLKGLSSLHDLPDSKFEFKVLERGTYLRIETNISASTYPDALKKGVGTDKVIVTVQSNGRIRVEGDTELCSEIGGGFIPPSDYYACQLMSSRRHGATKKALTYVSKKAAEKGLIS